jgi:hypothetical protein
MPMRLRQQGRPGTFDIDQSRPQSLYASGLYAAFMSCTLT